MRKPQFIPGYIYHIYHRGIEERQIFNEEADYFRFVHDLFEFNDVRSAINLYYKFPYLKSHEVEPRKNRKLIVEILAFCLMPNHFHLMIREIRKNGIIKFMQKLNTGYTMYFNKKYQRAGPLLRGRFKATLIKNESHFIHLPFYIHFNPLDLIEPKWRSGKITNFHKAMNFLNSYRWSSHLDYFGKKNFPSVTQPEFLNRIFKGKENYKKLIKDWLKQMDQLKWEKLKEITAE